MGKDLPLHACIVDTGNEGSAMKITHCQINHLTNPLGYQFESCVCTWTVEDAVGARQASARIEVAADPGFAHLLYDTGRAALDSLGTELGLVLTPRTRYFWRVTVRTDAGDEATSETQWFETGKRDEPWEARWISDAGADADSSAEADVHPTFRVCVPAGDEVSSARLYICGLGLYAAYVGGRRVGDEHLTPYCNDYTSWLQYQTYDVTDLLREQTQDAAELAVTLGNGWYSGRYGIDADTRFHPYYGTTKKLIAELRVLLADGREVVIGTDESWTVTDSAITFSNIYDGERRDDWRTPAASRPARLCDEELAPLVERLSTPVTVVQELPVVEVIRTPAGETVLDVGQSIAGIFRLRVHGVSAGQKVRLQFGEVLQDGCFYRGNLGSARAEYVWTSSGADAVLEPLFTFYGYRYVKVEGMSTLVAEDFCALAMSSHIPQAGVLTTGLPMVNKLISNTQWGQRDNFIDVPTDCPQRDERMGWTGDAQVFSRTALYLTDCYAFWRKYLHDMACEQEARGGEVPNMVPSVGSRGFSPAWGDATTIIPWNLYVWTGDAAILREHFVSMVAWVDYMTRVDGDDCGWRRVGGFGDWLALDHPAHRPDTMQGGTDEGFIAEAYYYQSALIVAKAARVIQREDEAQRYQALADQLLARIRGEYFSASGRCCVDTQTGHVLALWLGLTCDPAKEAEMLARSLRLVGGQLRTGFVGTPLLCLAMSAHGMDAEAYDLLLNEGYPGWLYAVKLGATTIWERWNSLDEEGHISSTGMNSLNHYSYGSIVEWMWRAMVGLEPAAPGFRRARIAPHPDRRLGSAEGRYESAAGRYRVAWQTGEGRRFRLEVEIPFGCEADVVLPYAPEEVYETDNLLVMEASEGVCHVGPGSYAIEYQATRPLGKAYTLSSLMGDIAESEGASALLATLVPGAHVHAWDRGLSLMTWLTRQGVRADETFESKLLMVED